jgi:hypothetical protein
MSLLISSFSLAIQSKFTQKNQQVRHVDYAVAVVVGSAGSIGVWVAPFTAAAIVDCGNRIEIS